MATFDDQRATDLAALATTKLGRPLTPSEDLLIKQSSRSNGVIDPIDSGRSTEIDGQFIRWLSTDSQAAAFIDAKGIRLRSATVLGVLDFDNCCLLSSLTVQNCDINGDILLNSAITKTVTFEGCTFNGVIKGDDTKILGSLCLSKSIAMREISLSRVEIGGELSFAGLDAQNSNANICLDEARVTGSVFLTDGFKTQALIQMHSARMVNLNCCGATLAAGDASLSLDGITVYGDLLLSNGFSCLGEIRLPGAQVFGNLECIGAMVGSLICHNMTIHGDFMWVNIGNADQARLSLVGVKVKTLRDQKSSWPSAGNLELEGLTYEHLTVHDDAGTVPAPKGELTPRLAFSTSDRIEWLCRQKPDRLRESQPWIQLAKVAQSLGDERGAHKIVYRLACHRANGSSYIGKRSRIVFAWVREQPFRIAWSISVILFLVTAIFWSASLTGAIAPREKDSYEAWAKGQAFPVAYPRFNPLIYSLENELPLVKLGQDDKWAPDPSHKPVQYGRNRLLCWTWILNSYGFLTSIRWFSILLGWVQATVLAAALGNRFRSQ